MSQTWDLTLVLSPTQTFTADAIVVARQTWDLTLVGTQAQITADAIIYDPVKYKTFTADAVVQEYDWYDAEVTTRRTVTFTADAIVVSGVATQYTNTFTADAIVTSLGVTAAFTADALVAAAVGAETFPTHTAAFTADAVIIAGGSLWHLFKEGELLDAGTAFPSLWSGPYHTFGDPDLRKRVRRIHADGRGEVDVYVATEYDSADGTIDSTVDFSEGEGVFGGGDTFGGGGVFAGGIVIGEDFINSPAPGVARAWSITFASQVGQYWELDAYTIRTLTRKD